MDKRLIKPVCMVVAIGLLGLMLIIVMSLMELP